MKKFEILLDLDSCGKLDSPMSYFKKLYDQNLRVFCSQDCPCSGNPKLYQEENRVEIFENKESC